jgi:hypothetical protein
VSALRKTAGRWGERGRATVARALAGVDRARAAAWRRRAHHGADLDAPPDAVLAVVAHWRPDGPDATQRLGHLEQCLDGILGLGTRQVVAVVLTNAPEPTARDLGPRLQDRGWPVRVAPAAAISAASGPREVLVVGWRPGLRRRHGFYLTWAHVPLLRAAAESGRFTHLVYLEDDMRLTDDHLRYWAEYRAPLAELGLLPGFTRFELHDGERYLVDVWRPLDPALRRRLVHVGGEPAHVVNLVNPYQALYILDRNLWEPHFRFSRGRSPLHSSVSVWAVRERASSGPIFDDVPDGFISRNVVPVRVDGDRQVLDPRCLVEHMAPSYTSAAVSDWFGGLPVDELFAP